MYVLNTFGVPSKINVIFFILKKLQIMLWNLLKRCPDWSFYKVDRFQNGLLSLWVGHSTRWSSMKIPLSIDRHAQNNKLTRCTRIYLKRDLDLDRHWCLENFPSPLLYILSIWVFWPIVQVSKRDFFGFSWSSFSSDSTSLNISACLRHVLIRKRKSWLTKVKHLYYP